jgi:hypothetical protein
VEHIYPFDKYGWEKHESLYTILETSKYSIRRAPSPHLSDIQSNGGGGERKPKQRTRRVASLWQINYKQAKHPYGPGQQSVVQFLVLPHFHVCALLTKKGGFVFLTERKVASWCSRAVWIYWRHLFEPSFLFSTLIVVWWEKNSVYQVTEIYKSGGDWCIQPTLEWLSKLLWFGFMVVHDGRCWWIDPNAGILNINLMHWPAFFIYLRFQQLLIHVSDWVYHHQT